jgi:tRNA modification GTPase
VNGRLDLVQAEAVADLIDAATPRQAALAFDQLHGTLSRALEEIDAALLDVVARLEASVDFPEEGYHFLEAGEAAASLSAIRSRIGAVLAGSEQGQVIREGRTVTIAGQVNVGKSSIFNYLVGFERTIVSAAPGTTRDMVTERLDIEGIPVTLVDTAGRRVAAEDVEREGVVRAKRAAETADATIVVLDRSRAVESADRELVNEASSRPLVVAINKSDLPAAWPVNSLVVPDGQPVVCVSARTGEGMTALRKAIGEAVGSVSDLREPIVVTNRRHMTCLSEADASIARAEASARAGAPEEFVLADLQSARGSLEELRGRRTPEDVLRHIFERFCIGK